MTRPRTPRTGGAVPWPLRSTDDPRRAHASAQRPAAPASRRPQPHAVRARGRVPPALSAPRDPEAACAGPGGPEATRLRLAGRPARRRGGLLAGAFHPARLPGRPHAVQRGAARRLDDPALHLPGRDPPPPARRGPGAPGTRALEEQVLGGGADQTRDRARAVVRRDVALEAADQDRGLARVL